jgi:hypothetical protein
MLKLIEFARESKSHLKFVLIAQKFSRLISEYGFSLGSQRMSVGNHVYLPLNRTSPCRGGTRLYILSIATFIVPQSSLPQPTDSEAFQLKEEEEINKLLVARNEPRRNTPTREG